MLYRKNANQILKFSDLIIVNHFALLLRHLDQIQYQRRYLIICSYIIFELLSHTYFHVFFTNFYSYDVHTKIFKF